MVDVELLAQRRQVLAFIKAQPLLIRLLRPAMTDTAAGGRIEGDPVELDWQRFRLVPFKRRLTRQTVDTQDGDIPLTEYVLVGAHNADVQTDDYFEYQGRTWRVVGVEPKLMDDARADRRVVELEVR